MLLAFEVLQADRSSVSREVQPENMLEKLVAFETFHEERLIDILSAKH